MFVFKETMQDKINKISKFEIKIKLKILCCEYFYFTIMSSLNNNKIIK